MQPALNIDTLVNDVTAFMVDRIRNLKTPYALMLQEDQNEVIQEARTAALNLVQEVVSAIAADGREVLKVDVEKVVHDGKKIQMVCTADKDDDNRFALFDAAGKRALVAVADIEKYDGGEAPQPEPDQSRLAIAEPDGAQGLDEAA